MSIFSDITSAFTSGISNILPSLVTGGLSLLGPEGSLIGMGLNLLMGGGDQSGLGGAATPAVQPFAPTGGGGSSQIENTLLGAAGNLDQQMNSLTSQMNNPNLTEGQMLKLQTQIQKLTRMYEMISEVLKSFDTAQSTAIRNVA